MCINIMIHIKRVIIVIYNFGFGFLASLLDYVGIALVDIHHGRHLVHIEAKAANIARIRIKKHNNCRIPVSSYEEGCEKI